MFSAEDIQGLIRREASAQKKLLKVYGQKVYNLVYYHLQNREDAEEVTQDVFIKIINKSDTFRNRSKFDTWLYRLAVNHSLDKLRFNQRKKRKGFKTPLHELAVIQDKNQGTPSEILQSRENQKTLLSKIEELPIRQKTALLLSKLEGKPQKEIAEIMEITPKAVESLIQRAKASLKEKLKDYFRENKN
jgi:RNA polymerase sigma factor (sigma-70 family)